METTLLTSTKKEIVKINPSEYGLDDTKASQIAAQFQPMLDKMIELESEFNEVIKLDIEHPDTAIKARELRLKYVKVRTGTDKIHKEQKSFYLAGGRFVDGWKSAQLFASQGIEQTLEGIEKNAEIKEKKRIEELRTSRHEQLSAFVVDPSIYPLGELNDQAWGDLLNGARLQHAAKIETERKAEEERIAREKAEAVDRERIRLENERLKAEAQERDRVMADERIKAEAEKKAIEEKAAASARKEKEKQDAILKAERDERERVERELKSKKDAEIKAEQERQAKIEADLSMGDKEKFQSLIADIVAVKTKYTFKSKKYQTLQISVNDLFDKIITFVNGKI